MRLRRLVPVLTIVAPQSGEEGADNSMTKYPTLMIDHPVVVEVGVRAGVAQYPLLVDHSLHLLLTSILALALDPQYHQPHHAAHSHL